MAIILTSTNKDFGGKKPRFIPRNSHKYIGDVDNIIYRSTWELKAFKFCDNNPHIIAWSAEEIVIDYMKPVFNARGGITTRPAKYFTDLYVEYVDKNSNVVKELLEIKPKKQTKASRARNFKTNFYENMVYLVNTAKWDAAKRWCAQRGIKFSVITEDTLFKS